MNKDIFIKSNTNSTSDSKTDDEIDTILKSHKYIDTCKNPTELLNTEGKVKRYINKLNANMNNLESCQDIIVILIELLNKKEYEVDKYKMRYQAAIELLDIKKEEIYKLKKKVKKYSNYNI